MARVSEIEEDGGDPTLKAVFDRQREMFGVVEKALLADYAFADKGAARKFIQSVTQAFIDWNQTPSDAPEYAARRDAIAKTIDLTAMSSDVRCPTRRPGDNPETFRRQSHARSFPRRRTGRDDPWPVPAGAGGWRNR